MNEIKSLVERAQTTLRSAEVLIGEGDFDGSVSRSYYYMFYSTEALLLTKELKFSSHKGVISLFGEHFIKTKVFDEKLGRNLSKVLQRRMSVDYSFAPQTNKKEAEETLKWAEDFMGRIKSYLKDNGYLK